MKKTFMGVRLKRLREERSLTQAVLATKLGISLSYLNQLENNQRPLTLPVLLALNATFGLDVQSFAEDEQGAADLGSARSAGGPGAGRNDRHRRTARTRLEHARRGPGPCYPQSEISSGH